MEESNELIHTWIFQQCLGHNSPVSNEALFLLWLLLLFKGLFWPYLLQLYLFFSRELLHQVITSLGWRLILVAGVEIYSVSEKYSFILLLLFFFKKYRYMLAISTQHCIGGFSWCSKGKKTRKRKKD